MTSPPVYTGTKPNEFKRYRKKVKLWLLFTRTPSSIAIASCFEQVGQAQLGMPATDWNQRMWLLPMERNVILDTLEEAFPG